MTGQLTGAQIVEAGLAAAEAAGGDETVVVAQAETAANIRWANNTMTTNGLTDGLSFFVVVIRNGAAGTVAGSVVDAADAAAVAAVVARAQAAAVATAAGGRARDAMPLVAPGGTDESRNSGDDFAADPAPGGFELFDAVITGLAQAIDSARSAGTVLFGFARHELTTIYLGTSTGVRRRWVQPTGILELNAKSGDLSRSSWSGSSTTDFTDVDVARAAEALTARLGWSDRRIELPPGRYDTVLPPTAVADFMVQLGWAAAARPAHEGRSAFAAPGGGVLTGARLTDLGLTLATDPGAPGLACTPFVATGSSSDSVSVFDNGAAIGRTELVRDGVIHSLAHTRGSAQEYGEPFTPVADNLLLTGGVPGRSEADLVAGVEWGLLVTSQWYLREVDPMTLLLTGLTRDGVFLIEHGEITAEVNNFRFNMSPLEVLRQTVDVGDTQRTLSREWSDWFTRSAMPPMRVAGFNMSSVSRAT